MDFGLSDDQKLLEQTVRAFLADRAPIARVRELRDAGGSPIDRALWRALAELGISGILIDEKHGGSGLALLDAALVAQAAGHAVTPAPILSSAVIAPVALAALEAAGDAPDGARIPEWLAGIASGESIFGVACTELFSVREAAGVALEGGALRGRAMMAHDALAADCILIALDDQTLAVIRADASGLHKTRLPTIDATRCTSELELDGVRPEAVFDRAGAAIARMLDAGRIALAADTLGACESMIEQSVAYAQERKQFDRLIGSFQAVKHMCAEMIAELEPARSLVWYAAHSFDALPDETPLLACATLSHLAEIGHPISSVSTQVHGGIGWTDEQNLHFWFKRIGLARHLLGGPEFLRDRAARIQGLCDASLPAGQPQVQAPTRSQTHAQTETRP